ncbi:MAG: glycosyltransferase family 4 protein [Phycisphaerae bacterium]
MAGVWIVNPFDPLPGDPEQSGRYASLARMLRDAGHDVTWWTSSFSHRFKRPLNHEAIRAACSNERLHVRFIETPHYQRNVSLRRLRSHRVLARRFLRAARAAPAAPDVIVVSNPPPDLAAAAARIAQDSGARLIIDVQDIWVDNFRRLMPAALRPAAAVILRPWVSANRRAYAAADAVVGVAPGYADEPLRFGRSDYRRVVVPLGVELAEFDRAASAGRSLLPKKQPGEIRAIYSGSYSQAYDVLTVARIAVELTRARQDVHFVFSGRGDLEPELRAIVADQPRISYLGFAPFEDWAATLRTCDIGWNAIRPENLILLPNKIFYYWAAGLALLNSIPGECARLVAETNSGLSYACGDVDDARGAMQRLIADPSGLAAYRESSRQSAEHRWDRRRLYQPFVELVNEMATSGETRSSSA